MTEFDELLADAGPVATKKCQEIIDIANCRSRDDKYPFAAIACSLVLQKFVMTAAKQKGFIPGSPFGRKFIEQLYEQAKKDAVAKWENISPKTGK